MLNNFSEECNFKRDSEALHEFFEESLEKNDFYMQDITGFAQVFAYRVSVRYVSFLYSLLSHYFFFL